MTRIALPVGLTGAVTVLGIAAPHIVTLQTLPMLYLAVVVTSALGGGRLGALLAAGLGFVAYDFCFIEPRWTLTVAHSGEVIALLTFIAVAVLTGNLAGSISDHAAITRAHAERTERLLEFSRLLASAFGMDAVLSVTVTQVAEALDLPAVLLTDTGQTRLALSASSEPALTLERDGLDAAELARIRRTRSGATTSLMPHSPYLFVPITSAQRVLAVLGLRLPQYSLPLDTWRNDILVAMLAQAAIAIDRAQTTRAHAEAALLQESERLQSALLSSLSHDLRTPLASITGAASSLRQLGDKMDAETRNDLLLSIEEDAGQLNRFVANLFDMTRIESGALKVRRDPIGVPEVIERAVGRIAAIHPGFAVETSFAANLPQAEGDAILLEQAMFNLLDNARKHAGTDEPVTVFVRAEDDRVVLSVTDRGKGIAAAELEQIFDKFYRGRSGPAVGTGLGLSIVRGFVAAMGGTIAVESPAIRNQGTRFTIRLPIIGAGRS